MAGGPYVLVDGVRGLLGLGDRQPVLLGERDLDVAGSGDRSRIGLMAFSVGSMEAMETSRNEPGRCPLPILYNRKEMKLSAPNWWAARKRLMEIRGRDGGDQRVDAFVHGVGFGGPSCNIRWRTRHGRRPRRIRRLRRQGGRAA